MTTIKRILCAIDLTKARRHAFDRALSIARVSNARLYILHAIPATRAFSWHQSERLDLLTDVRARAERARRPGSNRRAARGSGFAHCAACTRERPTWSCWDPTDAGGGSGSGRARSGNACSAAPRPKA